MLILEPITDGTKTIALKVTDGKIEAHLDADHIYTDPILFIGNLTQFILKHLLLDRDDVVRHIHTQYATNNLPIYCKRCGIQINPTRHNFGTCPQHTPEPQEYTVSEGGPPET